MNEMQENNNLSSMNLENNNENLQSDVNNIEEIKMEETSQDDESIPFEKDEIEQNSTIENDKIDQVLSQKKEYIYQNTQEYLSDLERKEKIEKEKKKKVTKNFISKLSLNIIGVGLIGLLLGVIGFGIFDALFLDKKLEKIEGNKENKNLPTYIIEKNEDKDKEQKDNGEDIKKPNKNESKENISLNLSNGFNSNNITLVDVSNVVDTLLPSMVCITNQQKVNIEDFTSGSYGTIGAGSGVIIAQDEENIYILTNEHVIVKSETLAITFVDGIVAEGKVKNYDVSTDLAVVSVLKEDLPEDTLTKLQIAKLGDSSDLKLGQGVIAIGNALGDGQSVTVGIISVLDKNIVLSNGNAMTYIQTDAAINPGNSGGALINSNGEVIGINDIKVVDNDVEGMGYAIPITDYLLIIENLLNYDYEDKVFGEKRGYLGISCYTVSQQEHANENVPFGIKIEEVSEGSSAMKGGMKHDDVIISVNGRELHTSSELVETLSYCAIGDELEFEVYQKDSNGKYKKNKVVVVLSSTQIQN